MKNLMFIVVCAVAASCGSSGTETSSLSADANSSQRPQIDRGDAALSDIWAYLTDEDKGTRYRGTRYVGSGNFTSTELDRCTVAFSAERSSDGNVSNITVSISSDDGWKSSVDLTSHLAQACELKSRKENGYQLHCWGGGPRDAWSLYINRAKGVARYSGSRLLEADQSKCTGITFE